MLTFEQIKELIELVWEKGLQGVEIERSGFRVKIDGKPATTIAGPAVAATLPAMHATLPAGENQIAISPVVGEEAGRADEAASAELDGLHLLSSPIVGTFYAAPSPDTDPYVAVGDRVRKGQVLCIVEAMKLMNEIECDEDGVIERVFVKNAQPVEYGEPLFAIRAD